MLRNVLNLSIVLCLYFYFFFKIIKVESVLEKDFTGKKRANLDRFNFVEIH